MKTTCAYCGIVDRPHICPHKKRKTDRTRKDNKVYESKEYRKLRKDVLEDFKYVDVFQFYVYSVTVQATTTHHIIEIMEDESQAIEYNNLIPVQEYMSHKAIHSIYKSNDRAKKKLQKLLQDMRKDYIEGDRTLGKYEKQFKKIVSPRGCKTFL